jgi:signal transduction histidine kinase
MSKSSDQQDNLAPEQFSAVLMSFIHDVKNSLLFALGSLENLYLQLDDLNEEHQKQLALTQYELRRINNALVQMLSLYKMETHLFSIQSDQYNVYDFLEELIIINTPLNQQNNFVITLECDDSIEWYFDKDLLTTIINSILNNSIRYSRSKIIVMAEISENTLKIHIEDDGNGFPESMLVQPDSLETAINMKSGSTGLGLYFAEKIANIHHNGKRQGYTHIDNNSRLGGGRFSLVLP